MGINLNLGSEFISMTCPKSKSWMREIYFGYRDGTGRHGHLSISGSLAVLAETWYLRDINNNELIKNGNELVSNTSQLLLDCIPNILREFQHSEKHLFWKIGSLDSFFSRQ